MDTEPEKSGHEPGPSVLEMFEGNAIGKLRRYKKGSLIFSEGDQSDVALIIKRGYVKTFSDSSDGKVHTYEILGTGRLAGVAGCLLGKGYECTCEALEDTEAYTIGAEELHKLLSSNGAFSIAIMRELALGVQSLTDKVRGLSMLDVPQRLRHSLVKLADDYGSVTENGVKIDLEMTHEELAEFVSANRSTTSSLINELKRQGFLWMEARRLVIIPPEHIVILDGLSQAVLEADDIAGLSWAKRAVEEGVSPFKALDVLTAAIRQVDRGFARGKLALPDVVGAAAVMKFVTPVIDEEIKKSGILLPSVAKVVIGTVRGDVHDIGKTMAATLLTAAGFEVLDLGVDVPAHQFVKAIEQFAPDIVAMSALMSVTAPEQATVIRAIKEEGLRDRVKVMVGGGGVTRQLAERIEADGYEPTAQGAVELALRLSPRRGPNFAPVQSPSQ